MPQVRPFEIDKRLIFEAYKKIKSNGGSAGIDDVGMEVYSENLNSNLYCLWNRMSSGSYMPKAVKLVEIPKSDGGKRPLGIPTISDRIAQMAAVMEMEPFIEPCFHEDSYLRLNEDKTKIVFCKMTSRRTDTYPITSFDYLGFTFRPRAAIDRRNKVLFTSFLPAISKKSTAKIHAIIKSWNLSSFKNRGLRWLAEKIDSIVRGWITYYARFGKTEFWKVMKHLNLTIARWVKKKYKRFWRKGLVAAHYWLGYLAEKDPNLFYHWQIGYVPYARQKKMERIRRAV